jgi:hypothetical protein
MFFFLIPAYLLFTYYYLILKLWAAIIFWNHSWIGRNLGVSRAKSFLLLVSGSEISVETGEILSERDIAI